jgi:hypothetical protein
MKINITNIPDVDIENLDSAKVELANKVIRKFYPIVNKVYSDKISKIKKVDLIIQKNKVKINKEKSETEKLLAIYKRKSKIKTILERISKLVSSGLVNEINSKKEMISVLKNIDDLSDEKLNLYLSETLKILDKRFSKNLS